MQDIETNGLAVKTNVLKLKISARNSGKIARLFLNVQKWKKSQIVFLRPEIEK